MSPTAARPPADAPHVDGVDLEEPPAELRPYSDVTYVFEPNSLGLVSAGAYLEEVWDRRRFAVALAQSELRGPRASTVLGEVWGVLDPLFQAAIYWFLITVIRGKGVNTNSSQMLTQIMSGFFLFQFTATAMSEGGRSIIRNKGLILNTTFPRALLPMATLYKGLLELGPAMVVYAVVHVLMGAPVGAGLFALPFLFVLQVSISAGLAMIFSTLTIYIRDMSNILDYIMRILLFATPVIYPVAQLPASLQSILIVNPIFNLFAAYQAIFAGQLPSFSSVAITVVWAIVLPIFGFRLFVSHERGFAMRL